MAGAVGVVKNTSVFASFVIKDWQAWMTEAVILHVSGMSIPELRVKFSRTDSTLRNILNTQQAREIVSSLQSNVLKSTISSSADRIISIRDKALKNMEKTLEDEGGVLATSSPFAFLEASRKVYETVSKHDTPSHIPASQTNIQNIQQNFVSGISEETLTRLRSSASLFPISEIPTNVEYLGTPPTGEGERTIHAGGVSRITSESEAQLALVVSDNSTSSNRSGRFSF